MYKSVKELDSHFLEKLMSNATTPCSGPECPLCNLAREISGEIKFKNFSNDTTIFISKEDHDNILNIVDSIIKNGEELKTFEKNKGYAWVTIPLSNGKTATLSVARSIIEKGSMYKVEYEWMLEKE